MSFWKDLIKPQIQVKNNNKKSFDRKLRHANRELRDRLFAGVCVCVGLCIAISTVTCLQLHMTDAEFDFFFSLAQFV